MAIEPVAVDGGLVSGVLSKDGEIACYRGIPFAAPPLGELRWRAPQPVVPWDGVLIGDRYGPACLQPLQARDHFLAQFGFADVPECGLSEHCLFLNVWTPIAQTSSARPVIVWVYGGGHRFGSGSHPVSEGEALARRGAVVVSINYRLGALGYLAHPKLTNESGFSGNYACLDVLAALRWVQSNIAAFSGDRERVALFGQSAGAAIVNVLMASRLSRGLFQRAIAHSSGRFSGGPMGQTKTLAQAESDGYQFMHGLGAETLEQMRNLPADVMYGVRGQWNLIIDGTLLREPVQSIFERGEQLPIPLLVGFNRDDATAFPMPEWHTQAGLLAYASKVWGANLAEFRELYPFLDDASARTQSYAVRRDISFAYQAWRFGQLHRERAPVYLFEFNRALPLPTNLNFHEPTPMGGFGAYHGGELWYVFDNRRVKPWHWTDCDGRLAEAMGNYWFNFASNGRPDKTGMPRWPALAASDQLAMQLGETIEAGRLPNQAALECVTARFAAR